MTTTPLLKLPQIAENQGSKHITHNEALRQIEAVLVRVLSRAVDDESTLSPVDGDSYIVDAASFAIVAVDTGGEIVSVGGDQTGRIGANDAIEIDGSTGNDGTYTVASVLFDSGANETDITVNENITDATADGNLLHADDAFNGQRNSVAFFYGGDWSFVTPIEGMGPLWVNDEDVEVRFDGASWATTAGGGGGASDFTGLGDTPSGYTGSARRMAVVNSSEDALEFVGLGMPVQAKTGNYTVASSDHGQQIAVTDTTSARTITLLAAATAGDGFTIAVYIEDATNKVTIDADGTELIDGSETLDLVTGGDGVLLVCDGSKWRTVASQITPSGSGAGDVTGPGSSTDNAIARFSGSDGTTIQNSKVLIDDDGNLFGHGQKIDFQTADFTLAAADAGKNMDCASGSAFTITVPSNSNVALPVGYSVGVVQADGNKVTFSGQSGVTIQSSGGLLSTNGQWSAATLYKRATDEWVLVGDLS